MARYMPQPRQRTRRPLWQLPLRVAADALGRMSKDGADNAARAIEEEEQAVRNVDAQITQLRERTVAR